VTFRAPPSAGSPTGPKTLWVDSWPELALLGPALLAAVIYQGGLAFWLGATLVLLSAWVLARLVQTRRLVVPLDVTTFSLLGFWIWVAATTAWSPAPMMSLYTSLALLTLPLAYLGWLAAIVPAPGRMRIVYALAIVIGLCLVFLSFNEARLGVSYPRSLFINKNTHAGFLNLVLLLTAGLFLNAERRRAAALLGGALLAISLSAALPASRGALAGLIVGLALLALVAWTAGSRKRLVATLALVAGGYLLGGSYTDLTGRVATVADAQAGAAGRWYVWEGALRTLEAAPWYGNGVGTFWLVYPPFQHPLDPSLGLNPHNDYLELLIDTGIPGLGLFLLLAGSVLWLGRGLLLSRGLPQTTRIETAALLGALGALAVHSVFSHNLYHPSFAIVLGLFVGRLQQLRAGEPVALGRYGRLAIGVGTGGLLLLGAATMASSAMLALAFEARDAGRLEKAQRLVERVRAWLPSDDRAPWLQARIALDRAISEPEAGIPEQTATYAQILGHLDAAEALNPLRPQIPMLRAQTKRRLEAAAGTEEPWADYARALALDPRYVEAREALAESLLGTGRVAEAHRILVEGLKHDYEPLESLPGYLELTRAVCEAVGDGHNAERAEKALARFERERQLLRTRRPLWRLPWQGGTEAGSADDR
jgi:O-antigen ligase